MVIVTVLKQKGVFSIKRIKKRLILAAAIAMTAGAGAELSEPADLPAAPAPAAAPWEAEEGEVTEILVTLPPSFASQPKAVFEEDVEEKYIYGYEVKFNGRSVGLVSEKDKNAVNSAVREKVESFGEGAELADTLTFEGKFIPVSQSSFAGEILSRLELSVKTVRRESRYSAEKAEVIQTPSDKVFLGDTVTVAEGKDGLLLSVYRVTEINGKTVSEELLSRTEVEKKQDKLVLVGKRAPVSLPADKAEVYGGFIFPLADAPCYVSSTFGYREFDDSFHNGTDYAADFGTPVYSAADGVVTFAGEDDTGFGNYVQIDHGNGFVTGYAHLSSIAVRPGDTVRQGDQVGSVGSTGYSTGNHLHLLVKYSGEYTDPQAIFGSR